MNEKKNDVPPNYFKSIIFFFLEEIFSKTFKKPKNLKKKNRKRKRLIIFSLYILNFNFIYFLKKRYIYYILGQINSELIIYDERSNEGNNKKPPKNLLP